MILFLFKLYVKVKEKAHLKYFVLVYFYILLWMSGQTKYG